MATKHDLIVPRRQKPAYIARLQKYRLLRWTRV
jgi:hypothetical protein